MIRNFLICFGLVVLVDYGVIDPKLLKSAGIKIKNTVNQTALKIYKLTK